MAHQPHADASTAGQAAARDFSLATCPWYDRNGNRNTPEYEAFVRQVARDPHSVDQATRQRIAPDVVPGLIGRARQAWIDDGLNPQQVIDRHRAMNPIPTGKPGKRSATTDTATARRALGRYLAANTSGDYDAPVHRAGFLSRHRAGLRINFHAATVATFADEPINGSAIVKALHAQRRGGYRIELPDGSTTWAAGYAWLPADQAPNPAQLPVRPGRRETTATRAGE